MRADDVHVRPCQSQGVYAYGLQASHDVFVHQSAIDHGDHFQHGRVRDAPSVHHLAFDAQPGGKLGGRAASAVYQDFVSFDGGEVAEQPA